MKTLSEINETHQRFSERFGFDASAAQQSSAEWFRVKLGVISASNASKVVAKKDSETRATYMAELIAQIATGQAEEINSKYLDWGKQYEDAARSAYEFTTGTTVTQLPFVFKDDSFRVGCSPDGFVTESRGVEIKCPYNAANYVRFATDEKIKSEYVWQYQFTLWVLDAAEWDFVQYHPQMKKGPIKIITVARDAEKMKVFDELIPAFISDMDDQLKKLGFTFGDQWK